MKSLTQQDILKLASFKAKKVIPTKIRAFTQDDVKNVRNEFLQDESGTFFVDLEGRRQDVREDRGLCVGRLPEDRWTSEMADVLRDRRAISSTPDESGFILYVMKHPLLLTCFDIPHPFQYQPPDQSPPWKCPDSSGGFITWNGQKGKASVMRVVQRMIFEETYTREDDL